MMRLNVRMQNTVKNAMTAKSNHASHIIRHEKPRRSSAINSIITGIAKDVAETAQIDIQFSGICSGILL